jgi:hypothetical protein
MKRKSLLTPPFCERVDVKDDQLKQETNVSRNKDSLSTCQRPTVFSEEDDRVENWEVTYTWGGKLCLKADEQYIPRPEHVKGISNNAALFIFPSRT